MKRNLISPNNVVPYLKDMGYNYFCNERGELVYLGNFETLSFFHYHTMRENWYFWFEDDKLWSESICGFMIVFPLRKSIA